eukprot:3552891-Amphidinium_carterae.1
MHLDVGHSPTNVRVSTLAGAVHCPRGLAAAWLVALWFQACTTCECVSKHPRVLRRQRSTDEHIRAPET